MNHTEIMKVLELLGFKQSGPEYDSYHVVPFVGNIPFRCIEMMHSRKLYVWILTEFKTIPDYGKQKRAVKHGQRWNKRMMDTVRKHFPEADGMAEIANTLEVCP